MSTSKIGKRKLASVQVSYDSGSDADVDSDEEVQLRSPSKKFSVKVPKQPTKRHEEVDDEMDEDSNGEEKGESDSGDEEGSGEEGGGGGGGGWADAMASILRKEAPAEGSAVLAKSKDYAKAKEEENKEFMERVKERQSKKKWENMAKAMPKVTDREYERTLQRIATKGVVQLFNAVKKQQKTREDKLKEVGGSQRKRAKVEASLTKGNFLDLLKGTPAPTKSPSGILAAKKPAPSEQPSWGVLRDDFMLGAEMKDWDKEADDDDEEEEDGDSGLSSDSD